LGLKLNVFSINFLITALWIIFSLIFIIAGLIANYFRDNLILKLFEKKIIPFHSVYWHLAGLNNEKYLNHKYDEEDLEILRIRYKNYRKICIVSFIVIAILIALFLITYAC
jgi:hypothetical protein